MNSLLKSHSSSSLAIHDHSDSKFYQTIFDQLLDAIFIIDVHEGKILNVNEATLRIFGHLKEHMIGKHFSFIFPPQCSTPNPLNFIQLYGSYIHNQNFILSNGSECFMDVMASLTQINQTKFMILILRDVSEQKQMEDQINEMNQELEKKIQERTEKLTLVNQILEEEIQKRKQTEQELQKALSHEKTVNNLKSKLVSMVSHEFRTPLSVIQNSSDLLKNYAEKISKKEQDEIFVTIESAINRMVQIMEKTLFLGKVESGQQLFEPKRFNLPNFCKELQKEFFNSKHNRLFIHNHLGTEWIFGDEFLLRQILSNIINNAIKFSKSKVELSIDADETFVYFKIHDHGIGIPNQEKERIFEYFHRCTNASEFRGTGLGLAIAKRCTDLHQGTIDFTSKEDKGTTFVLKISIHLQSKTS
jgi:PAS domain S-box-containing protein